MAYLLFESGNLENRNLKSEFISQTKSGIEIKKNHETHLKLGINSQRKGWDLLKLMILPY